MYNEVSTLALKSISGVSHTPGAAQDLYSNSERDHGGISSHSVPFPFTHDAIPARFLRALEAASAVRVCPGVTHSVANTAKRAIIIVGCAIAFGESMAPMKMAGNTSRANHSAQ